MKFLILLVVCVAVAFSAPVSKNTETNSYNFSYTSENAAKSEIGDIDGNVRGAYTYIDNEGAVHHVKYVAGPEIGFKIIEDSIDITSAKFDKEFPLATEIKLVNGLTPEVAAARNAHLTAYNSIRSLLPELEQEEERVIIHHLHNEQPATVHRTTVPEIVHSMNPPLVKAKGITIQHTIPAAQRLALIDGLSTEKAAKVEAHFAFQHALNHILPELKGEGEITIPVHHVHHVHQQGHVQAVPPKITKHEVIVNVPTKNQEVTFFEEPAHVHEQEHLEFPLASEIELIEGYTPEVWASRQAHLAQFAAIRSLLPITHTEE